MLEGIRKMIYEGKITDVLLRLDGMVYSLREADYSFPICVSGNCKEWENLEVVKDNRRHEKEYSFVCKEHREKILRDYGFEEYSE